MHQIKNLTIDLNEVRNIKQTQAGLEFSFDSVNETLTAKGAKVSDLVDAVDIETLLDIAIKVESECGLRIGH